MSHLSVHNQNSLYHTRAQIHNPTDGFTILLLVLKIRQETQQCARQGSEEESSIIHHLV